jgi:tRNA threonylcarbamoyladenosine biosynthesis protein TsaB
MKVLGIECSTKSLSVAVLDNRRLLFEHLENIGLRHSERLIYLIDLALKGASLSLKEIDGIAVSLGPGSFCGLRVGIATAKVISYGMGIPLVGVGTLEALLLQFPSPQRVCALIDAGKGDVYYGIMGGDGLISSFGRLIDFLPSLEGEWVFTGDGAIAYRDEIIGVFGERAGFPPDPLLLPRASMIALVGMKRMERGERDDPFSISPIYLKRSYVE